MAETTGIAWTDHTFNAWVGCQAVSKACDHCYAQTLVERWGGNFATRRRTSGAYWKAPLRWNAKAKADGVRRRVFCCSLADVFDNKAPPEWRADLWSLIRATPWLQWQLLTKRPQNIREMLPPDWGHGFHNVWLGTTVENQTEADRRIPALLAVPATVRFLSCEPLLGPVDVTEHLWGMPRGQDCDDCPRDENCECGWNTRAMNGLPSIDWVIIGGESGHHARPMHREWVENLMRQCRDAGVPVFVKQVGCGWQPDHGWGGLGLDGGHNADPAKWPVELRVQQFPEARDGRL